jgi:hypothetical protein
LLLDFPNQYAAAAMLITNNVVPMNSDIVSPFVFVRVMTTRRDGGLSMATRRKRKNAPRRPCGSNGGRCVTGERYRKPLIIRRRR